MTLAQQFIAGIARIRQPSPVGTAEGPWPIGRKANLSRAYGTYPAEPIFPAINCWAILSLSLRDHQNIRAHTT